MEFSEKYFEYLGVDSESFFPRLSAKFREQLCFKGKKINYEDFAKFVNRKNKMIPLFAVKDLSENDVVLDMFPLVNVGLAEILTVLYNVEEDVIGQLYKSLVSINLFENVEEAIVFIHDKLTKNHIYKNENNTLLIYSLKSSYCASYFPAIQEVVALLDVLRLYNPKLYCEVVLDIMKVCYTLCSAFITDIDNLYCISVDPINMSEGNGVGSIIPKRVVDVRKIGYTVPETNKKTLYN